MGKIAVSHFLNTNLKPYIINGEKYYSIYILVRANRINTKIKSKVFSEYYTEHDFEEITNSNNPIEFNLIENEKNTIINILSELLDITEKFDTTLFAAIYNHFDNIFVFNLELDTYKFFQNEKEIDISLYDKNANAINIELDNFFTKDFSLKENNSYGMSLYTWFSPKGQKELEKFIKEVGCNIEFIGTLNRIIFLKSFDKLYWIFKGSKKLSSLIEKYSNLFELVESNLLPYYKKLIP